MRRKLKSNPAIKKQLETENKIIKKLGEVATLAASVADMDMDYFSKRVQAAEGHEYGSTAGLLNLITAVALWPVDRNGSMDNVAIKQTAVMEALNKQCKKSQPLTLSFLRQLKESRGSHSFVTDDHNVKEGIEPEYDRYAELLIYMAGTLGVEVLDFKLDKSSWTAKESDAAYVAQQEFIARENELKKHESEMAALESKIAA